MERRDVLKAGTLSITTAASVGPRCATVPHTGAGEETDTTDATGAAGSGAEFLTLLDRQLGYVDHAQFVDEFVTRSHGAARGPDVQRVVEASDDAFRRMLRTLLITQGFR